MQGSAGTATSNWVEGEDEQKGLLRGGPEGEGPSAEGRFHAVLMDFGSARPAVLEVRADIFEIFEFSENNGFYRIKGSAGCRLMCVKRPASYAPDTQYRMFGSQTKWRMPRQCARTSRHSVFTRMLIRVEFRILHTISFGIANEAEVPP